MNDRMLYLKRRQRMIRSFRIMKGEHWKFKVRKSLREAKLKKFYKLIVKCSKKERGKGLVVLELSQYL